DQALLIFHNRLPHEVEVLYTSDFCYKSLVHVKASYNNASAAISTKFPLSLQVESNKRNAILCNQTYEEGGHYSVWILRSDNASKATCIHTVDRKPHNSYLFALTVMVFVNYGGGGYWFFQHAPWN
uniref:Uncharacterized protein n=1 Tax=Hippocampus comes TaxID=109280 RepID=A0A3Q2XGQ5_HIPCM